MRKTAYRIAGLALALTLGFTSYATETDLDGVEKEIEDQQNKIDQTEKEIDVTENRKKALEDAKSSMESYLKDLNEQYASIGEEIEDLNNQISDKEKEIEQAQADLEEAKKVEEKQYEDMKTRIQYMYENPQTSLFALLLEGGSFSSALNRINYAASIAAYDKQMMEDYVAQKEAIAEKEAVLEGEKEALDELHASVVEKQNQVSALASSTSSQIGQHVSDIAAAQADLDGKTNTLENQKEVLQELLAEKKRIEASIEAAKAAEIISSLGEGVTGVRTTEQEYVQYAAYNATEEEVTALAVLIHCEAANQGDDGRLAVGAVVMNRIRDSRFAQNDIISVIRASGQFSPVTSGRFDLVLDQALDTVSEACFTAARRAIAGESNVGNRVFFRTYANYPALSGLVINAHIFSYTWNYAA
jgi:peptidoglycan hydrolase CwlO-like protein